MKCTAYKVMVPEWDNAYLLKSRGRYIPVWLLFLDKDKSLLELQWLAAIWTNDLSHTYYAMYVYPRLQYTAWYIHCEQQTDCESDIWNS